MAECSVIEDLSEEQFITFLRSQGDFIDFSAKEDRISGKHYIYLGKVLDVGQVVRQQKRRRTFHDTLFVMTSSFQVNEEDKEFRIIFLGSIAASLVEAGLKKNFLIAVLNPNPYTAFKIPSFVVGPKNAVVWLYRKPMRKNAHEMRKKTEQLKRRDDKTTASTVTENTQMLGIDSDDTDADPLYVPEEMSIEPQRCRSKIQASENTLDESGSIITNSSSTCSVSIQRNHNIYRSAPVNVKEILSQKQERSSGRSSASGSPIQQSQINCECNPNTNKGQNECLRTPKECSSNLHSQNRSVVGSLRDPSETFSCRNFVSTLNTKPLNVNNFVDRTRGSQRSECTQDANCFSYSHSYSRHCVKFHNDCHCDYHQCNSYRPNCCRPSCHCQPCGSYNNHCFSRPACSFSHKCKSERDCRTSSKTNGHCRSHPDHVCSSGYRNPMPHCSGKCRGLQQSGYRHLNNWSCSHNGFDCRQHCSSEFYNCSDRVVSHSNLSTQNESALKSLEQLIERRSEHMNNRENLDCTEIDSPIEAAKRTQNWVLKWTPSSPVKAHSPPNKPRRAHSTPKSFPKRNKDITSCGSESVIVSSSDSDSESNKSRKRLCTPQKDLESNKNLLKSLVPNSSQSTTSNVRVREHNESLNNHLFSNLMEKIKSKDHKSKKKLFNFQDNSLIVSEKSIIQAFEDKRAPFNSEQNDLGKSIASENLLPSSVTQVKSHVLESSEDSRRVHKMDTVKSGSHQEDNNRKTSHIEISSNLQIYSNTNDHLTETSIEIEAERNEKSEPVSIGTVVHSSMDHNNAGIASNQSLICEGKSLSSENCEMINRINLVQTQKYSEQKFPESRLEPPNSKNISLSTMGIMDSGPNKCGNHSVIEETETDLTIVNRNTCSDQTGENMSTNKSLSLPDYTKIKLKDLGNNEDIKKTDNNLEPNHSRNGKMDDKSSQSECNDQVELVCQSKLKKRKRRKKRTSLTPVSRSSSESAKSNETIDLENTVPNTPKENVESTISSPCTFYDAQSSCSQKSKLSSAEKWCLKPLHDLNLDPKTTEAFLKMLPSSSKQRSYNLTLFLDFQATGIIIGTMPDVIENPFSLVRGYCNDGCQKSYTHEEYKKTEEFEYTCTSCRYRSHWICPGCKEKGLRNPLCMHFLFEVHLFDGEYVLRIEVENQEAVLLLGCTPTVYLKESLRLIRKLQKIIVTTPTSNLDSVPLLKATIKTTSKNGNTILKFQNTSLKKNLVTGSLHIS